MPVTQFPPVESADKNGVLAIGGDLHPSSLILAYEQGIFPWPISSQIPLAWFSPDPRGVLDFEDLKISKRLQRYFRGLNLDIYANTDFESVIAHCAQTPRKGQEGTWITREIQKSYLHLHQTGYAYCLEGYSQGELIAGIYGVIVGGYVSGESMFGLRSNASKAIVCALMEILHQAQINWLDTQTLSSVIKGLGAKFIPRTQFSKRINEASPISVHKVFGSPGKKEVQILG